MGMRNSARPKRRFAYPERAHPDETSRHADTSKLIRKWRRTGRAFTTVRILISILFVLFFLHATLPNDSAARSSLRLNSYKLTEYFFGPLRSDRWLYEDPQFPLNWSRDVAIVLKTGFGTQERARAWLEALPVGISPESVTVVADFESLMVAKVHNVAPWAFEIHNVVEGVVQNYGLDSPRGAKYRTLAGTVAAGESVLARNLSSSIGWELDAMKFIPALQLAYQTKPDKKWYLLVDDDTYLIKPSLDVVLSHYDPTEPHYLGNAVGDYRQRFAHGGSSIAISHAAMSRLFAPSNAQALSSARETSLTEVWGDRLLARELLRLGVHIDERASRFFNGEQPRATRLREHRFCVPLATFHKLSADEMRQVGRLFRNAVDPILWIDLWDIYGAPPFEAYLEEPMREGWDHVGVLDEHTKTLPVVDTALECLRRCEKWSQCLAWIWEEDEAECHLSPWVVLGMDATGRVSGPHVGRLQQMANSCR